MKKTISVVAAIIENENNYLIAQRGHGKWAGYWEFPGGKIEPGESPEEALKREIKEELCVNINIKSYLKKIEYDYDDFHLSMDCYNCFIKSGKILLNEHSSYKFVTLNDIKEGNIKWVPADAKIFL